MHEHRLPQRHDSLLHTGYTSLEHEEVVLDLAVAHESTEPKKELDSACYIFHKTKQYLRSYGLLGRVEFGRSISLISAFANAVDLVVDRGTVMVTHLTSTSNCPLDVGRMPGTDTGDLAETLVRLARKLLGSPSRGNTVESVTLGDGNDSRSSRPARRWSRQSPQASRTDREPNWQPCPRRILPPLTWISIKMGLLLLERGFADLGVGEDSDDGAVFLYALKFSGDGLSLALRVLLGVFCECLFLGLVPVLVESSLEGVAQMLGPDSGERSQTTRSLNITNETDNNHLHPSVFHVICSHNRHTHRRSLNDSDGFDNFFLVEFGTGTVEIADDGGHASLVAHSGSEMDGLLGIIFREAVQLSVELEIAFDGIW